jgi:hypothetical protein
LSEKLILDFNKQKKQTPQYGHLIDSGDERGAYFFRSNTKKEQNVVTSLKIPLEIYKNVKIYYSLELPFFHENKVFDSKFINAYVQQLGYSIVNDIRSFILEEKTLSISEKDMKTFYLDVSYKIETNNEKFLSLSIIRHHQFGGPYPAYQIYTLNFAFNPERTISMCDIIDYSDYKNLEAFLQMIIDKYGENEECKSILHEYSKSNYLHNIDFTFNSEYFQIYYTNLLPHVVQACGMIFIPINEIKFKIK